jgi:hypothetical protein
LHIVPVFPIHRAAGCAFIMLKALVDMQALLICATGLRSLRHLNCQEGTRDVLQSVGGAVERRVEFITLVHRWTSISLPDFVDVSAPIYLTGMSDTTFKA